ncbi:MAG: aminoglycoside phosphotransferase family protein [Actinomycetota bacterium]
MDSAPPDAVLEAFALAGGAIEAMQPGNVHETQVVTNPDGRFVVQRINTSVFADPEALMENAVRAGRCMERVAAHPLEYRSTVRGDLLARSGTDVWRAYRYVEGRVVSRPASVDEAFAIGRAFGRFDAAIAVHPPERWHTVVPRYHDQKARSAALEAAVAADAAGRLAEATPVLEGLGSVLVWLDAQPGSRAWASVPVRVAHHDAKGVNLVFADDGTMAVLDLDTVMAGTVLSDVGELIRTCARPTAPDSPFDHEIAVAAVRGFVDGWGLEPTPAELAALPISGIRMTAQNSVRFLTDHLQGDTYYRVAEPGENLERALAMLAHAEAQIAAHAPFAAAVLRD